MYSAGTYALKALVTEAYEVIGEALVLGDKHDPELDTKEIAKRVRKDIADASKTGKLPKGLKVGVKIKRYAGGSSIDVEIKEPGLKVYDIAALRAWLLAPVYTAGRLSAMTPEAKALTKAIQGMLDAYNRQDIDSMSDYYNVHFYGSVSWGGVESAAFKKAREEALTPEETMSNPELLRKF